MTGALIGQRFSSLTVVSRSSADRSRHAMYNCICDCGNTAIVRATDLRNLHTTSCGCQQITKMVKHEQVNSRTYQSWRAMRKRCNDPNNVQYPNYGGRGIKVCDEWNDSGTGYQAFVRDMGERPDNMTLDRKDADGDYTVDNCRWATSFTQTWNKRNTRQVREEAEEYGYWEQQEEAYLAEQQSSG